MKLNKRKEFKNMVSEKFLTGEWGLDELTVLKENRFKYNFSLEDVGFFLVQIYQYTYCMAMEDGFISNLERSQLNEINMAYNQFLPKNIYEKNALMTKISNLVKSYEKTNAIHEADELVDNKYSAKEKVNNGYKKPYFSKMKLTPYSNYYF